MSIARNVDMIIAGGTVILEAVEVVALPDEGQSTIRSASFYIYRVLLSRDWGLRFRISGIKQYRCLSTFQPARAL